MYCWLAAIQLTGNSWIIKMVLVVGGILVVVGFSAHTFLEKKIFYGLKRSKGGVITKSDKTRHNCTELTPGLFMKGHVFIQIRLRMSHRLGIRHSECHVCGRTQRALLRDLGIWQMPPGQASGVVAT